MGVSLPRLRSPGYGTGRVTEECPSCAEIGYAIGTSLGATVFACRGCDLWFLSAEIRPNADRENHWYGGMANMSEHDLAHLACQMAGPYSRQLGQLSRLASGRDLLDVGCGVGMFLHAAKREWNAFGLETSAYGREFARARLGLCVKETIDELPVQRFDVVRLSHVLEHIPDPGRFLDWVVALLNPGGVVVIAVPNRESLVYWAINRLMLLRCKTPALRAAIYPDMHVLGFSERSLINAARQARLVTICVQNVSMGNRDYYPFLYDGLLRIKPISEIQPGSLIRYYLPLLLANFGNVLGLGDWIVAHFRKSSAEDEP